MSEQNFTPEGLARTVAGREVGAQRLDPIIGKLEKFANGRSGIKAFNEAKEITESYPKDDTHSVLMRKGAEEMEKSVVQATAGELQGEYEHEIAQAVNDKDKASIQKEYKKKFVHPKNPSEIKIILDKSRYHYTDADGNMQYATPLETIYGLASIENQLFDSIKETMVSSGEIANKNQLTADEHTKIQERIDKQVRQIGMNYLRGMSLPDSVGQIFLDKSIEESYRLLHPKKESTKE